MKVVIKSSDVGKRADVFVAEQHPQFTRSALEVLFTNSNVRINGQPAKPSAKLREGDIISVDGNALFKESESLELPVLYEDEDVAVINKSAGILTHSKGSINYEATVASFLKPKITDKKLTGNRAGIVHRLDRGTSGVIIGVKNSEALNRLQKQFAQRKTKKIYYAIVEGWPIPAEALIDAPIARNPKRPQTFMVAQSGKSAQTQYKTVQEFEKNGQKYSLLELKPITGRTNQLRVHLAYIKHPIVGDFMYGKPGEHMYLHANSLEITLPKGVRKTFVAPLPQEFNDFIKK
jgi:23S rRNA pseudouridine1911/1915/1917 synthase